MQQKAKANKPKGPVPEKTRLSSVANAIRLIKTFTDDDYEIGISDLAKRLLLPKSTVHRLAATLIDAGLLEQNPETAKYRLGLVIFELGSLVRRKMDFSSEAKPYLMTLREKTGETVHLAILDQLSILFINTLESKHAIRMTLDVGMRKPAYCTAAGKVLLAFQSPEMIERVCASKLIERTPNTIVDPESLRQELATILMRGYAIDDEESELGLRSIAAPVRDYGGNVIAATSVAGPAQRLTKKALLSYAPDVIAAGEAISQRLGYRASRVQRRM